MSREHDDAHYLHEKRGLSPVLRPPVQNATHLAWDGTGHLLVATADGKVLSVHPAMGTRVLLEGLNPPAGLGVDGDRFVLAEHGGTWAMYDLKGSRMITAEHPFEGAVAIQFRQGKTLLTGLTAGEKQVLFFDSGRKVLRIQLPPRAVGFISDGHFGLAQSTPTGLEVIYLRAGGRFAGYEVTNHRLVPAGDHMLGLHAGGMKVWTLPDRREIDVVLPGTTCGALSEDGRLAALGTATGGVALVDLRRPDFRANPTVVEATDAPIRSVAFSGKGRYLATGADGLILWTWGER